MPSDRIQQQIGQFPRRSLLSKVRNLLQKIPFKPLDINCLYFLEYTGIPRRDGTFRRGHCEVRRATLRDLGGITACQSTPEAFLRRFRSNDHCVVAVVDGRIVGYEWFCDKPTHSEERYAYEIAIPQNAIYAYDAYILPEHRLSGIWLKFKTVYLRELMQSLHKRKIITMIDRGNRMSMSTHLRFGFKLVRKVFVLKLLGKTFFLEGPIHGEKLGSPRDVPFTNALEEDESNEQWFSKSVAS
jgi:hypothetical protein